jgi:peptidyl serine alpha-galactosyltransferase
MRKLDGNVGVYACMVMLPDSKYVCCSLDDFYNKPWGLKHWLEFSDPPVRDDVVIALLDPDMIFLRPLTTQIMGMDNNLYNRDAAKELMPKVVKGRPAAQTYGLGAPWTNDIHPKFGRGRICGENSPCLVPNERFGAQHYSVGPPYLVEKEDMIRLAKTWTEFVPRVYEKYPYLLAEMYAYSMAAAHENLPHLQMEHYMVQPPLFFDL